MPDYIGHEPSGIEKAMPIILGIFFLAALASIPFMHADNERARQKSWQSQGCKMYDDEKMADVPVKCLNEFVDHYKAQQQRLQPPEQQQ